MTTPRPVTADIIKRAAEDSVAVYLDDFPGAAWDDGWFTAAYEIDSSGNGPCDGVTWEVYRDACKAAFVARRPVTGPDGDNPITDEQIRAWTDSGWSVSDPSSSVRRRHIALIATSSRLDSIRPGCVAEARSFIAAAYNARHAGKETT